MVTRQKRFIIWILWLLIVPTGIFISYTEYPVIGNLFSIDIILFLLLLCIITYYPIMINGMPIFLLQGVSLAIFLQYGLFVEIVLSQIGVMTILYRIKINKEEFFRIPMNSLMFFINSVTSGLIYYWLGGQHSDLNLLDLSIFSLIVIHQIVWFLSNFVCALLIDLFVYETKVEFVAKDQVADIVSSIIIFPIGLLLYSTYQELGLVSIIIVGIPLVSLAMVMRLYYQAGKVNEDLQKASQIGHRLTDRLEIKQVLDLFINEATGIFPVEETYIFGVDAKTNNRLRMLRFESKNELSTPHLNLISATDSLIGEVWKSKQSLLIHNSASLKKYRNNGMPDWAESILIVPVLKGEQMEGIVLYISSRKNFFEKNQLMIADILSSYLASAYENAKHYEETKAKSERCSLTKLYNTYYLEDYLKDQFNLIRDKKLDKLTLILMDLDHFKSINDSYGHLSGNDVLYQVAERLSSLVRYKGIAARYGGEEFVLVLPGAGIEEGYQFAELARQKIGTKPYELVSDLGNDRTKIKVRVTASIGVSTAPFDADDPQSLIRHADRAMYTGAKQAGRNKVAQYSK